MPGLAVQLELDPGEGRKVAASAGIEAVGDGKAAAQPPADLSPPAQQQPGAPPPPAGAEGVDPDVAKIAKASLPAADAAARLTEAVKLVAAEAPKSEPEAAPSLAALKPPDAGNPQSQGAAAGPSPAASVSENQHAASETRQVQHPVADNVPLGAVPIEVGLRAMAGLRRFEIRLDPPELGRIDVRLDMSDDGHVKAHLTVDKIETLALLQRDARTLERAFEQAGLKPSDGGVDLTLRDQNASRERGHGGADTGAGRAFSAQSLPRAAEPDDPFTVSRLIWRGRAGLDLRV